KKALEPDDFHWFSALVTCIFGWFPRPLCNSLPSPELALLRQESGLSKAQKDKNKAALKDPEVLVDFVDRIGEGMYITSASGEVLDANPATLEIFGFSSVEALRQQPVTKLVDAEMREQQLKLLTRDGSVRDFELMIRRPDGEI